MYFQQTVDCTSVDLAGSRSFLIGFEVVLYSQRGRISRAMQKENTAHHDLYSGLIRLHILHHTCKGEIFGLWMIEELGRHGYRLSPGTMYPLLHSLEKRGLLVSRKKRQGRQFRRLYRATPLGREAVAVAKEKVRELFGELFDQGPRKAKLK